MSTSPITITVDSRLRIPLVDLPPELVDRLREEFTHDNPEHARQKRAARAARFRRPITAPEQDVTWREEGDEFTLPRGGLARVREILKEHGAAPRLVDRRSTGTGPRPRAYELAFTPARFQEEAADAAIARQNCILRAPTGCVVGDAVVTINRAGVGRKMTLSRVVTSFNGGEHAGRRWNLDIPTFVRAPTSDGTVRLARVISARASGVRSVFRLSLETSGERGVRPGRVAAEHVGGGTRELRAREFSIEATADHRVLTPTGWVPLENLSIGDNVMVDDGIIKAEKKRKLFYKVCVVGDWHPHAGRRGVKPGKGGFTVPVHRLVAEASLNGMGFEEFVNAVRSCRPGLKFIDPKKFVVHHVNEDHLDNRPENLRVLTADEHRREHMRRTLANIASRLVPARIVSIEPVGEKETYDLEVEGAEAFIANEVAVHNSGKSCVAEMIIARVGLCSLVLVQTRELFDQWKRRLVAELGMHPSEIGTIGGGKKQAIGPVTIAMVQTFAKHAEKYRGVFGLVVFDEVQRAAADTFFPAIDACDAKYRIGISADERRKDGRDYLIYDAFGSVAADVPREDLIRDGFVYDVHVRLVPTGFSADWYAGMTPEQKQLPEVFDRLLREMVADEKRNALVARLARVEAADGHTVLVFSHRVEHCVGLRSMIAEHEHRVGVYVGDESLRRETEQTSSGLRDGKIRVAVGTYQSIGTGVDVPAADRGIATTPIHSNKQGFGQTRGRLCRIDRAPGATKTDAMIYVLWDRAVHGLAPLRNLLRYNAKNVSVLEWETGTIEHGRDVLRRAEDEEDAAAEARRVF